MRTTTPPTQLLNFAEQINCFEICGTDFGSNLICIAADKKLILGLVRFPVSISNRKTNFILI